MRAIVVGAGVAGLACGEELKRRGVETLVLEGEERAGGKVRTDEAAGCLLEAGPQTCIATPELLALCERLGVKTIARSKQDRARYLVQGGRLVSPLRALSFPGMARALWGAVRKGPPPSEDETVLAYATRRFGAEAARRAFDPLVSGIYAGDPSRLAYASALAKFGKRRGETVTFEGGMRALPDALARALGPSLRLRARVVSLTRLEPGGWRVGLEDGSSHEADAVVLACPAGDAAELVRPLDAALAQELAQIRYAPVTAVALVYPELAFPKGAPRGFGFLAASEERLPVLGCLFCPAPPGRVLLRPMLRGTPEDAESRARDAVEPLVGASLPPTLVRIHAHERAIPQYEIGHARRLRILGERLRALPGLELAGNAYRAVAVPDVIEDARSVAAALAQRGGVAPVAVPVAATSAGVLSQP